MAARSDLSPSPAARELLPLAACAGEPPRRVGRKAALLAWADAHELATPGGLVLPAERFWAALDACGAGEQARYLQHAALRLDPRHTFDVAAAIAEAMSSPAVEALAGADGAAAFDRLRAPRLVCRSSAAMEDGQAAAFPGVFLSVLDLGSPAALARAITDCWRSAFSADAIRYLLRVRAGPVDFSLALLLQRQVEAAWYGVYVSADPVTGADEPLADLTSASPGDLVAGGRVALRARRRHGRWTGTEDAPSVDASLEAVHRAGQRLVSHLGTGVDLEFALPVDRAPVLLQCRPLTRVGRASPVDGDAPAARPSELHGRPCAGGRAVAVATSPRGEHRAEGPLGIAVLDRLTIADYGLVFRAAGVVTEQDASPLSHVAILCRELGIPFVCGVAGATTLLVGRRVSVDGRAGSVDVVAGADGDAPEVPATRPVATPAITAVELVLRVLAEGRPGRPLQAEAQRVARRYARAPGADAVRLVPHPLDGDDLDALQRMGEELFGPGFSVDAVLAGVDAPDGRR